MQRPFTIIRSGPSAGTVRLVTDAPADTPIENELFMEDGNTVALGGPPPSRPTGVPC